MITILTKDKTEGAGEFDYMLYHPEKEDRSIEEVKFSDIDDTQTYVTYDTHVYGLQILSLRMAAKILDFKLPNSLNALSQRYIHKSSDKWKFKGLTPEKMESEAIFRIWKDVIKKIEKLRLTDCVVVESEYANILQLVNGNKVKINNERMNREIASAVARMKSIEYQFGSDKDFINYIKSADLGIETYHLHTGRKDLIKSRLMKYADQEPAIKDYYDEKQCKYFFGLRQYSQGKGNIVENDFITTNYQNMAGPTGRLQTYLPNAMGLRKQYINEPYISYDYKANEPFLFLALFNKLLLNEFLVDYQGDDLYCFLYNKCVGAKILEDLFRTTNPTRRNNMKTCVNMLTNGASFEYISYKTGVDFDKLRPFLIKIDEVMGISVARSMLIQNMADSRGYSMCKITNRKYYNDTTEMYCKAGLMVANAVRVSGKDTKKWGSNDQVNLHAYKEAKNEVLARCVGYCLQSTSTTLFKFSTRDIIQKYHEHILMLRHDEIIFKTSALPYHAEIFNALQNTPQGYIDVHMPVSVSNNYS